VTRIPLDRILFGVVVAVSIVVVWTVSDPLPHLGGDNAGYIALAYDLVANGSYTDVFDPERLPHTKYPPVFPATLALLIAAGARSWVALKAVAAVATVIAVGFTYLWAARRLSALGAFAVALLLALSVGIVYYSQWVLSDPLFLALTMASLHALAKADGVARTGERGEPDAEGGASGSTATLRGGEGPIDARWLAVGVLCGGLAYFTRSAGLPLVVALLAWLVMRRAWRPLGISAGALGLPMLAWWLRGRTGGVAQYTSEFWMVNPYDPSLGTVGIGGLGGRVVENLLGYATRHLPLGVVGADAPVVPIVGVMLVVAALAGWVVSARDRVGPAELFFPLYAGLILLWPTVWSGDRFALPLLPLVFLYGAVSLRLLTRRLPEAVRPIAATVAILALLVPAVEDWRRAVAASDACPLEVREQDVWACYGPRVQSFMIAAAWTRDGLPEGASVLSRKPRHFYLQSGVPSRTFAFFEDPDEQLELADAIGASYVLLDRWDGFAARYVGSAVRARPGAFCYVSTFGRPDDGAAQLLGILPPGARGADPSAGAEVTVARCPSTFTTNRDAGGTYSPSGSSSARIPLLDRLDS